MSSADFTVTSETYMSGSDCATTIIAQPGVCFFNITFAFFNLKETEDCSDEYLDISGVRYCGQHTGETSKFQNYKKQF